jgi:5'-nucleotidase
MIFSGINHGPNMGDDTIYSGTVAAASEGFLLGIPSIAISLAGYSGKHFDTAALVVEQLLERHQQHPEQPVLLNVNVPDVPIDELQTLQVTRLGRRHHAEPVIKAKNRGETIYWVGPVEQHKMPGQAPTLRPLRASMPR